MSKSQQVLLALEDEQYLQLFEQALTSASFNVAIARDPSALNNSLQISSPVLVIISQDFSRADGLELSASLLERFPTLPILLLLKQDSPAMVRRAIHVGVSDCLTAPLHIDEILAAVQNSIKRSLRIGDWNRHQIKLTTASLQKRVDELQKLDAIVENIEDGVILLDEQSNLLLINPAARREFGLWLEDQVKGKPVSEVLAHPDLKSLLDDSKKNHIPHHEINFEDGRVLSAQCTSIPHIGLAITMQDITYLKHVDRLKNEFVQTVSHDLRSPLTAILGYVDLLDRVGPLNDRQRDFVKRVRTSVKNITSLVNDLLELGRIEAGLDAQKEMVPLDGIIRYTLETLAVQISDKQLDVELNLSTGLPPMRVNPIRMRQMLDNLLGNAIKYTQPGGKIDVKAEVQNDQVILSISDNGPGIPPADQPHIFEKFFRASNVPKGVGGTGLGLSIVKSIVENHQGRIWVESLPGHGTSFTVVLPIFQQPVGQAAA